jgi:hypothetical protein
LAVGEEGSVWTWALAAFLVAHGAVHACYLAEPPEPDDAVASWPFTIDHSWVLSGLGVRPERVAAVGRALTVVVLATFAVAAVSVLVGTSWWEAAAVVAASVSLVQMLAWFHPWLSLGVLIDVLLIVGVTGSWAPLRQLAG